MTTPPTAGAASPPPRPAAPDIGPGSVSVFKQWVYDVDAAIGLLRAPAQLLRSWPRHAPTA